MRLVVLSDTHSLHRHVEHVPDGDVLIHCGDFCGRNDPEQIEDFAAWMQSQPHEHKVVIAGNHDRLLEHHPEKMEPLLTTRGLVYLRDSGIKIDGVKFWGSPWTPAFLDWSFMYERGEEAEAQCATFPEDTDVLITHGPPHGILDVCPAFDQKTRRLHRNKLVHVGCEALRDTVFDRVKPKVHCFGHIHEGSGEDGAEGIRFLNASICTGRYEPTNPVRVAEI